MTITIWGHNISRSYFTFFTYSTLCFKDMLHIKGQGFAPHLILSPIRIYSHHWVWLYTSGLDDLNDSMTTNVCYTGKHSMSWVEKATGTRSYFLGLVNSRAAAAVSTSNARRSGFWGNNFSWGRISLYSFAVNFYESHFQPHVALPYFFQLVPCPFRNYGKDHCRSPCK